MCLTADNRLKASAAAATSSPLLLSDAVASFSHAVICPLMKHNGIVSVKDKKLVYHYRLKMTYSVYTISHCNGHMSN